MELSYGSSRGSQDSRGNSAGLCQTQGKEGGGTFIEMMKNLELFLGLDRKQRCHNRCVSCPSANDKVFHTERNKMTQRFP
jgi:hypothetical protein